ncbi:putative acyl-CoA dehydrogenase [Gordonia effusa NBRC 100432]|uniref:Putative acyl-CoA dehydrogenase n=1 Tax=Gordonia effusa NBRC 100432 TaxID=1077974 RepID=H0QV74_9ACTN|nr:acyl-CoA dehydrogenase family protein [Gordonia effusa]GAB16725.1 putative acyl-CoA dehydrogenase [Gordonia effusa NBRC 100432]
MDFTPDETTAEVAGLAADIAAKLSGPEKVAELEAAGARLDVDLWRELSQAGLLGLELPEKVGGGGLTVADTIAVAEQLGRALALVPYGQHSIAVLPTLAAFGSKSLRGDWLERAAAGLGVLGVAIDEDLGYDPASPATSLHRDGKSWKLNGAKVIVAFATAADALLVTAAGPDGSVVVLVPTEADGVRITATPSTGLLPTAQVDFDAVTVPDEAVLSGGSAAVSTLLDRAALAACAEQSGILERALELTAAYAAEREQFGKPIGANQAVAQRLADGYIDVQGLKLTTAQAAWLLANGDQSSVAVSTAKYWAAQAGHRVSHTAVHVHGGVGLDTSHPVHRYFLRAKHNEFGLGSLPATLASIGAALAAEPA